MKRRGSTGGEKTRKGRSLWATRGAARVNGLTELTVTKLEGMAYHKLVEQAESRISKETSIATNLEQVAELDDDQARERHEAEIRADTEKKLAAVRLVLEDR